MTLLYATYTCNQKKKGVTLSFRLLAFFTFNVPDGVQNHHQ